MLIKIQHTTLPQIFCEFLINFNIILKKLKGPDKTCQKERVRYVSNSCLIPKLFAKVLYLLMILMTEVS